MLPKDLTWREKIILKQRRFGLNQRLMASYFGVSYAKYKCWMREIFAENDQLPEVNLGPRLYLTEAIFITRRRKKIKQRQIASDMGVTIPLVNMMERGKVCCDRLAKYLGINPYAKKYIQPKACLEGLKKYKMGVDQNGKRQTEPVTE
jgi:hypothetical protein